MIGIQHVLTYTTYALQWGSPRDTTKPDSKTLTTSHE